MPASSTRWTRRRSGRKRHPGREGRLAGHPANRRLLGFTIDLDPNAISYTPPPDAARAAQKGRRCDLLHQRILDVLSRAEGADDELAAAILGATGLATPDSVPPT
jgi:hypothetical protein